MNLTKSSLRSLCGARDQDGIKQLCRSRSVPILADTISELLPEEARYVLLTLLNDRGGKILVQLPESFVRRLLTPKVIPEMVPLLESMESDDLTDISQRLDSSTRATLLRNLSPEKAEVVASLISYPEGTVGSIMRTEVFQVPAGISAGEALRLLRARGLKPSNIQNVYLTDRDGRLKGLLPLAQVILMEPEILLLNQAERNPVTIEPGESVDAAVRSIQDYDLLALPVTRSDGKLVGVVTSDDVMDVVEEETTTDFHKMAPVLKVDLKSASLGDLVIARAPWLVVLVFMNIFSGAGIAAFEETIEAIVALVFFLPLLIDSGGNAGSQSATLMIRAMAVGDVKLKDWAKLFSKEIQVSLTLGLIMALAVASIATFRSPEILVPVALSMVVTVLFGSLVGMSLPFLFTKFKLDPATASAPLITSLADIGGVLIYFSIATWYLGPQLAELAAAAAG